MEQSDSSFSLSRLGQIALTVKDPAASVPFYRDTLGMKLLFQAPPNLAFFDCDGVRLMLSPAEKPGESFSSVLYFRVDDIQKDCQTLAARGVQFEQGPARIAQLETHDLWMAFFRDPDRNVLALMSEVPRGK